MLRDFVSVQKYMISIDSSSSFMVENDEAGQLSHKLLHRIRRLDDSVVNRIAAGEIVIRPANALKELIENSIDAGSTLIDVLVKDGGFKLLQVSDNGCGIQEEDLSILCERFTTSKITSYEDLNSISTYGFRGEALASISHISHLSVTTKRHNSQLAYRAHYSNGSFCDSNFKENSNASPKPVAGKNGTQISVEDLFYNSPSRLKSLASKSEEYLKVLDIVGKYAVHSKGVGFSCKRFGESFQALVTRPLMSLKDRIRTVFGKVISTDLVEFELIGEELNDEENKSDSYGLMSIKGAFTNSSYVSKKRTPPVFFINDRLVDCEPLKRCLRNIFQFFLPKGSYPFIYLSLNITPSNLDVNVHPTKREVRFLNENEIIEKIGAIFQKLLHDMDSSRRFVVKNPISKFPGILQDEASYNTIKRQENKLVRVDPLQSKLGEFFSQSSEYNPFSESEMQSSKKVEDLRDDTMSTSAEKTITGQLGSITERKPTDLNLHSINCLKDEIMAKLSKHLTTMLAESVYIGIVDAQLRLLCFQYDVKLILCDYARLLYDLFYQLALSEFSNFGLYVPEEALSLEKVLSPLYHSNDVQETNLVPMNEVIQSILSMKEMYHEYFQLEIECDAQQKAIVKSLPMFHKGIRPIISKLPHFFYRLGAKINYDDENECLQGVLRQISLLYIPEPIPDVPIPRNDSDPFDKEGTLFEERQKVIAKRNQLNAYLENTIFPLIKQRFVASNELSDSFKEIANLPGLYRVFERC